MEIIQTIRSHGNKETNFFKVFFFFWSNKFFDKGKFRCFNQDDFLLSILLSNVDALADGYDTSTPAILRQWAVSLFANCTSSISPYGVVQISPTLQLRPIIYTPATGDMCRATPVVY